MSKAQHTPGPWFSQYDDNGFYEIGSEAVSLRIAFTYGEGEADEANTRLIAAAPDLLSVLSFILRGMDGGHIKCAPYLDFDPDAAELEIKHPAERIRAAIAKATGGAE